MAPKGTLKKVLGYIGRYKLLLPISIALAVISVALTLYIPVLIGDIIDLIGLAPINFEKIIELSLFGGVIIAITALCTWCMTAINNKIAYSVLRDIRTDAFEKLHKLPLSYLDTKGRGDLLNRVINDADQFSEGLLLGFSQLFTGILTIVGTLGFMLYLNPIIAAIVFLLTPLSLFIAKFIASKTHSMFLLRSKTEAEETAFIEETITAQKVVKAFSHEDEATEKFDGINERLGKCTLNAIFFSSLTNPATRFVNSVVYAAVALAGALIAIYSPFGLLLTVGEIGALLAYANQYTKPFNEISGVMTEFQNALSCASRVFELTEESEEEPDKADALMTKEPLGEVVFDNVSFSYTPEKPLIRGLNLSVKPGQRIAIVGPTGCGKTTLINLLMRFYDVCEGEIRIDGVNIKDMTRQSLRESFGMVLQDTWITKGTVKENIAFGKPDATEEEIVAAAKAAHSHSFIKRLKNGYDTLIGEGGEGLSQGQMQLIAITRVMLTLPPMLILDEATSSIDTRTEIRIGKAFERLMSGRTSFIVAHRLSTVKEADCILVMRDGNVVEKGTHKELLSKGGFYSELYNSQFAH